MKQIIYNLSTGEIVAVSDPGFSLPVVPAGHAEAMVDNWIVATPGRHRYVDGAVQTDPALESSYAAAQLTAQVAQLTDAVQRHMDAAAHAAGYDNIASAVTYADEPSVPRFQAEGLAFRAWRSLVWSTCYAGLDEVIAGTRAIPTAAQVIAELPPLTLPE